MAWALVQAVGIAIVGSAHDREPFAISAEALANGVFTRPIAPREFLIDDGHELRCVGVTQHEFATSDERDLHGM